MGWSKWFGSKGSETRTKTSKGSGGTIVDHILSTIGGSRKNHSHTVVIKKPNGRKTAHGNGPKNKRK